MYLTVRKSNDAGSERDYLPGACKRILSNSSHRLRLAVIRKFSFTCSCPVLALIAAQIRFPQTTTAVWCWLGTEPVNRVLPLTFTLQRHLSVSPWGPLADGRIPDLDPAGQRGCSSSSAKPSLL